ncbi:MAG: sensor histidine kinase [Bacteroidales bacterium]|nr:sensor histidine kinase [Bacteroidales bacterium]
MKYKLIILWIIVGELIFSQDHVLASNGLAQESRLDSIADVINSSFFETEEIKSFLQNSIQDSRLEDDMSIEAKSYFLLGNIYHKESNYSMAIDNLQKALKLYNNLNDDLQIAKCHNNLGTIYQLRGEFNNALQSFLVAYEMFNEITNYKGLVAICNNIGSLYYYLDNSSKAIHFYNKAIQLTKQIGDSTQLYSVLANKGVVFLENFNTDSALWCFKTCWKYEVLNNDSLALGKTCNNIGRVFGQQNNYDSSIFYYNKALLIAKQTTDFETICSTYSNMALLYKSGEKYTHAKNYYDSSRMVAENNNLIDLLTDSYFNLSSVYEHTGDVEKAFNYFKEYEILNSQQLLEQNTMAETEAVFVKQRQQNKILQLEKEREKRKRYIVILIGVIILVFVIGFFLTIITRIRNRAVLEKTLAEQKNQQYLAVLEAQEMERKRIAGDLHDSVGQILSAIKLNMSELGDSLKNIDASQSEILKYSLNSLDNACDEVRTISHNLMPGSLIRLGLISAIKDMVYSYNKSEKFEIGFECSTDYTRMKEKTEVAYFRISQELVKNAIKHARANEIKVVINQLEDNIELIVKDNGIGLDKKALEEGGGIGWKNINSRVAMIKGTIDIQSSKNGTHIKINSPIK